MKQKREPTRVYAVLARSADDALAQVAALALEAAEVELAGKLSKRMSRSLKIEPGELRLI